MDQMTDSALCNPSTKNPIKMRLANAIIRVQGGGMAGVSVGVLHLLSTDEGCVKRLKFNRKSAWHKLESLMGISESLRRCFDLFTFKGKMR